MGYPRLIDPRSVSQEPTAFTDFLPSLCQLTGTPAPSDRKIDGASLFPAFKGKPIRRKTPLFWFAYYHDPICALRDGEWCLMEFDDQPQIKPHPFQPNHMQRVNTTKLVRFELYNLKHDPEQKNNQAEQNPNRVASMRKQMLQLKAEVIAEGGYWYKDKCE